MRVGRGGMRGRLPGVERPGGVFQVRTRQVRLLGCAGQEGGVAGYVDDADAGGGVAGCGGGGEEGEEGLGEEEGGEVVGLPLGFEPVGREFVGD